MEFLFDRMVGWSEADNSIQCPQETESIYSGCVCLIMWFSTTKLEKYDCAEKDLMYIGIIVGY